MANAVCNLHKVQEGSITVSCDNESTLAMAFDQEAELNASMSDNDLLFAIHCALKDSTISWQPQHILGHQDRT
jgi:hypothetical protein